MGLVACEYLVQESRGFNEINENLEEILKIGSKVLSNCRLRQEKW